MDFFTELVDAEQKGNIERCCQLIEQDDFLTHVIPNETQLARIIIQCIYHQKDEKNREAYNSYILKLFSYNKGSLIINIIVENFDTNDGYYQNGWMDGDLILEKTREELESRRIMLHKTLLEYPIDNKTQEIMDAYIRSLYEILGDFYYIDVDSADAEYNELIYVCCLLDYSKNIIFPASFTGPFPRFDSDIISLIIMNKDLSQQKYIYNLLNECGYLRLRHAKTTRNMFDRLPIDVLLKIDSEILIQCDLSNRNYSISNLESDQSLTSQQIILHVAAFTKEDRIEFIMKHVNLDNILILILLDSEEKENHGISNVLSECSLVEDKKDSEIRRYYEIYQEKYPEKGRLDSAALSLAVTNNEQKTINMSMSVILGISFVEQCIESALNNKYRMINYDYLNNIHKSPKYVYITRYLEYLLVDNPEKIPDLLKSFRETNRIKYIKSSCLGKLLRIPACREALSGSMPKVIYLSDTCGVCYNNEKTNMVVISCGHSLCTVCSNNVVSKKCPFCNYEFGIETLMPIIRQD